MSVDLSPPDPRIPEILSIYPVYVCKSCGWEKRALPQSSPPEYCLLCNGRRFELR